MYKNNIVKIETDSSKKLAIVLSQLKNTTKIITLDGEVLTLDTSNLKEVFTVNPVIEKHLITLSEEFQEIQTIKKLKKELNKKEKHLRTKLNVSVGDFTLSYINKVMSTYKLSNNYEYEFIHSKYDTYNLIFTSKSDFQEFPEIDVYIPYNNYIKILDIKQLNNKIELNLKITISEDGFLDFKSFELTLFKLFNSLQNK